MSVALFIQKEEIEAGLGAVDDIAMQVSLIIKPITFSGSIITVFTSSNK